MATLAGMGFTREEINIVDDERIPEALYLIYIYIYTIYIYINIYI